MIEITLFILGLGWLLTRKPLSIPEIGTAGGNLEDTFVEMAAELDKIYNGLPYQKKKKISDIYEMWLFWDEEKQYFFYYWYGIDTKYKKNKFENYLKKFQN
ncbi:MAG: hypothetical protein LBN95_13755 [Prevotellaceae bacterium]|jgi:hypothetical protein|nr:hypothetical protein [Prevotellaceae bacterium]